MTNIQRIETAIANGTYSEPVLEYRIYVLEKFDVFLKDGADFRLAMSAGTKEDAEEMLAESHYGNSELFFSIIIN